MELEKDKRRPLKTRSAKWARTLARLLSDLGLKPNQISIASVFFAALSCIAFGYINFCVDWILLVILLIVAAASIQLRLLCNMLDGMLAVEGGMMSKYGDIYNDFPDRISDLLTLVGAGYAVLFFPWINVLGWAAALMAVMTAYTRQLGVACGTPHYFNGPMAKPHRMAVMTVACILSIPELIIENNVYGIDFQGGVIALALLVVIIGSFFTLINRLRLIAKELGSK